MSGETRKYKIEAEGIEPFFIEGPSDATEAELEAAADEAVRGRAGGKAFAPSRYEPEAGIQDLITQGMTFGLTDEALGAAGAVGNALVAPLSSEVDFDPAGAYRAAKEHQLDRLAGVREKHPFVGTVAEVGGSLLSLNPTAAAQSVGNTALSLAGRMRAAAKAAAAPGFAGGFGYGDGAVASVLGGLLGAGGGAAIGATVPVLGSVIGTRGAGLKRLLGRNSDGVARQIVAGAIEADNATPAVLGAQMDAARGRGVPLALGDTGENLRGTLASVSRQPGAARTLARGKVRARQDEQGERVLSAIGRDLGPFGNVRGRSDELMTQARTAAAPLYDEAYAAPVVSTPELDAILKTPAGRGALARARTIAANERRDPEALGFVLDGENNLALNPTVNLVDDGAGNLVISQEPTQTRGFTTQTLDYVKRGLDDIIEEGRDKVTGKLVLDEAGRAVNGVRAQLVKEIDRLNPKYAEARAAYAGPASAEEALRLGRKSLNLNAEDLEATVARLSEAEREQFALGFRSQLVEDLGRAPDGADQVRRLLGTPKKRKALQVMFGDEGGLDNFVATMGDEQLTHETFRSVFGNSATAERQAFDAQTGDTGLAETLMDAGLRGAKDGLWSAGINALGKLRDVDRFGPGAAGERVREGVAALLTETDPAVLGGILSENATTAAARQQAALGASRRAGIYGNVSGRAPIAAIGSLTQPAPRKQTLGDILRAQGQ